MYYRSQAAVELCCGRLLMYSIVVKNGKAVSGIKGVKNPTVKKHTVGGWLNRS
ncbi:MAG: hypothetical protein HY818_08180 [Acetobacterium woodii]|nr:hypothetical protein [Acetobacterium woodii]